MAIEEVGGKTKPPMWATESTLERVRDLVQTGVQLDTSAEKKQAQKDKANRKSDDRRIEGLGKDIDKSMKESGKFLRDRLKDVIRGTIVGGASFETLFKKMGQKVGDTVAEWGTKLPIAGVAIGMLVVSFKALNDVVQQALSGFQDLFDTGVGLNGSFMDLLGIAGDFNVGLFDVIEGLKNYSSLVVRLGTETNKGSRAFFELHDAVRDNIRAHHFYGLSIHDQIDFLGEYLETQKGISQIDQLNRTKTAKAVGDYIGQITKLSHFTGERRKQVQKEVEDVMREESMQLALGNMSQEMQIEARKFLAINKQYGEAAFQSAQEMIISRGTSGFTELTGAFVAMNPQIHRASKDMYDIFINGGTLTDEALGKFVGIYNKHGKEMQKNHGPGLAIIARLNDTYGKALQGGIIARNLTEKEWLANEGFRDSLTQFYMNWEDLKQNFLGKFYTLANEFMLMLEKGGVLSLAFDNLRKWITEFNDWATTENLQATMDSWVTTIKGWITQFGLFMDSIKPGDTDIKGVLEGLVDSLVLRFEYALDRVVDKLTLGFGGTGATDLDDFQRILKTEERNTNADEVQRAKDDPGFMDRKEVEKYNSAGIPVMGKGGIARVPSIFGEAGPEAAIPLPDGRRIPVEIKKETSEAKTFEDIKHILNDIKERIEFTAQETQTQTSIQRQIERKAGTTSSSIF